jgi:hypothetical protein
MRVILNFVRREKNWPMRGRNAHSRAPLARIDCRQHGAAMTRIGNNTGFAMVDALVALLLFALVLLAAIGALIQGMRATHAAALTSHAVDLAADLLEQRHALPDAADSTALLGAWNEQLRAELPESARQTARALVDPLFAAGAP